MPKPKIALYWCASCGGCEESVVDLAEDILGVVEEVDIVLWPVAMDFKKKDVEAMADGEILATMLNGAIRTSEQEEMAHLLRKKSAVMIAYGSCAHTGGIPSLANQFAREEIIEYVYEKSPSTCNAEKIRPAVQTKYNGAFVTLPQFHNVVRSLDQVVDVDYYLPGCPPTPKLLKEAIGVLLSGTLPPKGTVLSPDIALCNECPRKDSKPAELHFTEFKRPQHVKMDDKLCFLAQGIVCMGPATRGGCEAVCGNGNMPCTGCFGPTSKVKDHGAKILSALTSNIAFNNENEIDATLDSLVDPVGTFYRYGLANSLLRRKVNISSQ